MKSLKYLLSSIFIGILPTFAEEVEDLTIIDQQLPEIPNPIETATSSPILTFWEQYSAYIIVAFSAIVLLVLFILLYIFILRKSRVNFAKKSISAHNFQQKQITPQECLNSESTLPEAIKTFLIKTNLLP